MPSLDKALPAGARKLLAFAGLYLWFTFYGTWEDTATASTPGPTPNNSQPTPTEE